MQTRNYATKKKGKTEVYPFWNMEDIKNVVEWFEKNEEWDGYLITMFELLLGRRIGDVVMMKWSDLYYENGKMKDEVTTIEEQKTGKTVTIPVSSMVGEAVEKYLSNTGITINVDSYIFSSLSKDKWIDHEKTTRECKNIEQWEELFNKDLSLKRKTGIIRDFEKQKHYKRIGDYLYEVVEYNDIVKWQTDTYRKKLKDAVEDSKISYAVSTHSLRKSFGHWIYKMHMFDPSCLLTLQDLFKHATVQQTMTYIGLSEEKKRQYINDHGDFIRNVLDGKGDEIVKNMPVISLKTNDLMEIFRCLTDDIDKYQMAINLANEKRIV